MFSTDQLLELFVVLCIADSTRYTFFKVKSALIHSEAKSGPVRPDSTPNRFPVLISQFQLFVYFLVPTTYVLSVVCTGLHRPQWMNAFSLPEVVFGARLDGTWKNALRVLACFAGFPLRTMTESVFEHLGDQYHIIGRREKPRVVQTGPYALVRHPLYTLVLLQVTLQCLIFWSYVPLFALVATAAIFVIKIPIEEEAIQRDVAIREEYRAYMRKCQMTSSTTMFSTDQLLELFVVLCIADHYRYAFAKIGNASAYARSKSGPVRLDSMPTRLSVLITPFQAFIHLLVPMVYMVSVIATRFKQPRWMHALALPDAMFGVELDEHRKNAVRVFACVVSVFLQDLSNDAFLHLDDQFHPIGRRERSRIIQTGPYAWVRHPLYALTLLHSALSTVMFWSYAPLVVVVATAVVYAVKIPIEEGAILRDDAVEAQYRAYMCNVPAKLIPCVW